MTDKKPYGSSLKTAVSLYDYTNRGYGIFPITTYGHCANGQKTEPVDHADGFYARIKHVDGARLACALNQEKGEDVAPDTNFVIFNLTKYNDRFVQGNYAGECLRDANGKSEKISGTLKKQVPWGEVVDLDAAISETLATANAICSAAKKPSEPQR